MSNIIVELRNVTKIYKLGKIEVHALKNIKLKIRRGEVIAIMGRSGSGKSTALNLIGCLDVPTHGKIFFNGTEITGYPPHEVFRVGIARTFQVPQPFRKLTVLENLLVTQPGNPGEGFVKSLRRWRWKRFEEESVEKAFRILRLLNLDNLWDLEAEKLSGGQMKLLEVGKALMTGARLLIMDEPIAGVNPTLAHEVFRTFMRLRNELGITLFLVEHRLDIALQYTDYVYVMATGSIIAEGEPSRIIYDQRVIEAYLGE
ncbi:MAG: ABC transporter ATP-binding protein [Halobacteria archaeon]